MAHDHEEVTMDESPFAKQIRAAVRQELAAVETRIVNTLSAMFGARFDSVNVELAELRQRVEALEERWRRRDTLPAPSVPPMGGE